MTHRFRPLPTLHLPCNKHRAVMNEGEWKKLAQRDGFHKSAQHLPCEIVHVAFAWGLCKKRWRRNWLEKALMVPDGFALTIPFSTKAHLLHVWVDLPSRFFITWSTEISTHLSPSNTPLECSPLKCMKILLISHFAFSSSHNLKKYAYLPIII